MNNHIVYSQIYSAVARYLLRLDHYYQQPAKFYSSEWHRLITRIAIYESKGFVKTVDFGLTPSDIADIWIDQLRARPKLSTAISLAVGNNNPGPWDPIVARETIGLAVIHCRLKFGILGVNEIPSTIEAQGRYLFSKWVKAPLFNVSKFIETIKFFESKYPDPKLTLSPDEYRQMSTAPGAKQIGLQL